MPVSGQNFWQTTRLPSVLSVWPGMLAHLGAQASQSADWPGYVVLRLGAAYLQNRLLQQSLPTYHPQPTPPPPPPCHHPQALPHLLSTTSLPTYLLTTVLTYLLTYLPRLEHEVREGELLRPAMRLVMADLFLIRHTAAHHAGQRALELDYTKTDHTGVMHQPAVVMTLPCCCGSFHVCCFNILIYRREWEITRT